MAGTARNNLGANWQAQAGEHVVGPGERPTGWAGWLVFAGVLLGLAGLLQGMAGLSALLHDNVFVVPSRSLVVSVDYTAWGWIHLVLGVVAIVAAALLLRGNMVGRIAAAVIAAANCLVHFVFLPASPWWSLLAITFNVLVIYAIIVHGRELQSGR